jgi:hypothetical protein
MQFQHAPVHARRPLQGHDLLLLIKAGEMQGSVQLLALVESADRLETDRDQLAVQAYINLSPSPSLTGVPAEPPGKSER